MGHGSSRRSIQIQIPRGACTPSALAVVPRTSLRWPRTPFWVGSLLQELSRTNQDLYFLFELTNAAFRTGKFSVLGAGCAGELPLIDTLLFAPVIDGLLADAEIL